MSRKIIHHQQIIIAYKVIFDVELSFEGKKFYILLRRRFGRGLEALGNRADALTSNEKKEIKREMKRQMKDFKDTAEAQTYWNGPSKLFCKSLFIPQAK